MNLSIVKVKSPADIESVAVLAQEIWRQHFPPIIGVPQVEYMLEKFQSAKAIAAQMQEGTEYYIVMLDNNPVGYTALVPDMADNKMMINKIYILETSRGLGIGSRLLRFIENQCVKRGLNKLWLTVNRFNFDPIAWYLGTGFEIVDEVKKDIGGGFYMDDYIMEKQVD